MKRLRKLIQKFAAPPPPFSTKPDHLGVDMAQVFGMVNAAAPVIAPGELEQVEAAQKEIDKLDQAIVGTTHPHIVAAFRGQTALAPDAPIDGAVPVFRSRAEVEADFLARRRALKILRRKKIARALPTVRNWATRFKAAATDMLVALEREEQLEAASFGRSWSPSARGLALANSLRLCAAVEADAGTAPRPLAKLLGIALTPSTETAAPADAALNSFLDRAAQDAALRA